MRSFAPVLAVILAAGGCVFDPAGIAPTDLGPDLSADAAAVDVRADGPPVDAPLPDSRDASSPDVQPVDGAPDLPPVDGAIVLPLLHSEATYVPAF